MHYSGVIPAPGAVSILNLDVADAKMLGISSEGSLPIKIITLCEAGVYLLGVYLHGVYLQDVYLQTYTYM
jgi:hypothetical protein